jgi:hypothetical protein
LFDIFGESPPHEPLLWIQNSHRAGANNTPALFESPHPLKVYNRIYSHHLKLEWDVATVGLRTSPLRETLQHALGRPYTLDHNRFRYDPQSDEDFEVDHVSNHGLYDVGVYHNCPNQNWSSWKTSKPSTERSFLTPNVDKWKSHYDYRLFFRNAQTPNTEVLGVENLGWWTYFAGPVSPGNQQIIAPCGISQSRTHLERQVSASRGNGQPSSLQDLYYPATHRIYDGEDVNSNEEDAILTDVERGNEWVEEITEETIADPVDSNGVSFTPIAYESFPHPRIGVFQRPPEFRQRALNVVRRVTIGWDTAEEEGENLNRLN